MTEKQKPILLDVKVAGFQTFSHPPLIAPDGLNIQPCMMMKWSRSVRGSLPAGNQPTPTQKVKGKHWARPLRDPCKHSRDGQRIYDWICIYPCMGAH